MIRSLLGIAVSGALVLGCAAHNYRKEGRHVVLSLEKPGAKSVILACSLDGFKPHPANLVSGRWEVTLPSDRAFRYFYRVDESLFVPDCPLTERDDFGSKNCVFDPAM